MKQILIVFALLFASTFAKSQTAIEEYYYITKALAEDLKNGRDIKAGYSISDTKLMSSGIVKGTDTATSGTTVYLYLKEFKKKGVTKAIIAEFYDVNIQKKFYLCIPTTNSPFEVFQRAKLDFAKLSKPLSDIFTNAFFQLAQRYYSPK